MFTTYIVLIVNDNGTYGNTRISKDIIFDESVIFDKNIDNSPTDEEFASLPHAIKNMNDVRHEKVNVRIRYTDKDGNEQEHVPEPPPEELLDSVPIGRNMKIYSPQDYKDIKIALWTHYRLYLRIRQSTSRESMSTRCLCTGAR